MAKTIIVTIDKNGGTQIEAQGFTGDACLKETKSLEEALGKVEDRELKKEYYEKPNQQKLYTSGS